MVQEGTNTLSHDDASVPTNNIMRLEHIRIISHSLHVRKWRTLNIAMREATLGLSFRERLFLDRASLP